MRDFEAVDRKSIDHIYPEFVTNLTAIALDNGESTWRLPRSSLQIRRLFSGKTEYVGAELVVATPPKQIQSFALIWSEPEFGDLTRKPSIDECRALCTRTKGQSHCHDAGHRALHSMRSND